MSAPTGSASRRALLLSSATGVGALGALASMSATHAHPGGPDLPAEPVDAFLKLTGIPGSSQRDGHEEEIDGIEYVSFGGAHAEGARGGRRVEWEPFLFIVRSGIHSAPATRR